MTLVARSVAAGYPLLVSDILVSGAEVLEQPLNVPTVGTIHNVFPAGSGFVPNSLVQKTALIGDNIAIGWAGSHFAAKRVLSELTRKNQVAPFTFPSLMAYFDALDSVWWDMEVGFLGFIKENAGVRTFEAGSPSMSVFDFGDVCVIGTGAETFGGLEQDAEPQPVGPLVQVTALDQAIMRGLRLSGTLLSVELFTSHTLERYFGGGYEIATFADGKFVKLPKVTYCFWRGEISDSAMKASLQQVAGYEYFGESLEIRTVTFNHPVKEAGSKLTNATYVVPPIHALESCHVEHKIDLNSDWICNFFLIPRPNAGLGVFTVTSHSASIDTAKVRFQEDARGVRFDFEKQWYDEMVAKAFVTFGA